MRTLFERRWHRVGLGFPPVAVFAAFMGLATILHWDRFNHGHVSFFAWTFLYTTTPFAVIAIWFYNRRTDPGTSEPGEVILPFTWRWIFAISGGVLLAFGILLFIFPETMIPFWPWQLSPLTARVGGGWLAMPGVFALLIARDKRWSSARLPLESLFLSFVLLLLAIPRAWGDFDPANSLTWLFVGSATLLLAFIVALYTGMELRRWREVNVRHQSGNLSNNW
jgi:hypothetical protein